MQSRGGFSGELSMLLPMGRVPSPRTEGANYIRIYVEPGAGYRGGGGDFGAYGSAKAMLVLFSEKRLTGINSPPCPFVEIQHRFPVASLGRGNTRIVIGFIAVSCNHCGEQAHGRPLAQLLVRIPVVVVCRRSTGMQSATFSPLEATRKAKVKAILE